MSGLFRAQPRACHSQVAPDSAAVRPWGGGLCPQVAGELVVEEHEAEEAAAAAARAAEKAGPQDDESVWRRQVVKRHSASPSALQTSPSRFRNAAIAAAAAAPPPPLSPPFSFFTFVRICVLDRHFLQRSAPVQHVVKSRPGLRTAVAIMHWVYVHVIGRKGRSSSRSSGSSSGRGNRVMHSVTSADSNRKLIWHSRPSASPAQRHTPALDRTCPWHA